MVSLSSVRPISDTSTASNTVALHAFTRIYCCLQAEEALVFIFDGVEGIHGYFTGTTITHLNVIIFDYFTNNYNLLVLDKVWAVFASLAI